MSQTGYRLETRLTEPRFLGTRTTASIGVFNEEVPIAIDFELWLRVAMKYEFDYVDEPLLLYRTGHANLSRRFKERRKLVVGTIIPHILNECGGRELLSRREIAEAYANLFSDMGENDLSRSQLSAIGYQ